jgi:hypothetical protein
MILVLADGLGSGIKASVLSTLTATMAARFVCSAMDIRKAAAIIMETLPVCKTRQIAYSTFTIIDIDLWGQGRIIEFDNPSTFLFRGTRPLRLQRQKLDMGSRGGRRQVLRYAEFTAHPGDRLIAFSDGVSQAGVGGKRYSLGWGEPGACHFVERTLGARPDISARELSTQVALEALSIDGNAALDDITCAVTFIRRPRETMVFTGPPLKPERDRDLAGRAQSFAGRKVICGGTTARILARELGREITIHLEHLDPHVPPVSQIEGFDLVSEGTITLSRAASLLERGEELDCGKANAASRLVDILRDSDIIRFAVGTRINDAHQDPNLPQELDIRRNIVKRIRSILTEKYLKRVHVEYV